jgi:signal transduction histidine kinase
LAESDLFHLCIVRPREKTERLEKRTLLLPFSVKVMVMKPALRVLVVEDSTFDYEFLLIAFARHGMTVDTLRVETREEMCTALQEREWDIIISDHNLPQFSSFGALQVLQESAKDLPFIIVSGDIGEDVAVEAMRSGCDDYLLKDRLTRLGPAVEAALARAAMRREKRLAEERLRESESRLSQLAAHLDRVKEEERAALSRDLHDEVGGALAAVNFGIATLRKHLESSEEAALALDRLRDQVANAALSVQRLMKELRPSILDAGLVPALEWHTREFQRRTGIRTLFSSNKEEVSFSHEISTVAYRVCQESLVNVMKHAQARETRVELFCDENNVTLEVRDNGRGINPSDLKKPSSFGVYGMQERARSLGGWLEVSGSSAGTTVMLSLPWRDHEAKGAPEQDKT